MLAADGFDLIAELIQRLAEVLKYRDALLRGYGELSPPAAPRSEEKKESNREFLASLATGSESIGGGGRCVFAKCRFLAIVRGTMLRAEPCQSNTSLREHSLHGESHRTTPWDCAGGGVTTCLGRTADTPCTPTRIPSLDPTPLHHVTCGCRGCFRAPHT